MKALFVGTEVNLFEKNSRSRERIAEYGKLCDEIHIVVGTNLDRDPEKIAENVWIYSTRSKSKIGGFFDVIRTCKTVIEKRGFTQGKDLISSQDPFEMGLASLLVSKKTGIPLNVQVHIDFFSPYFKSESLRQKVQTIIAPFILKRADSIRVVSKKIETHLLKNLKITSPVYTLPIYSDRELIESHIPKVDLHEKYGDRVIILMTSRLVPQKNIPLALKALTPLLKSREDILLLISGAGKEKERILEYIKTHKLEENIILEDWTNDVLGHMKTADIFLLTSDYEGWGMTAVEASLAGIPVVMTDVGCAGEYIKHEQNGLIIPPRDIEGIKNAVTKLVNDPGLRKRLSNTPQSFEVYLDKQKYLEALKKTWEDTVSLKRI